jgi:paraquat-inducible protein A
MTNEHYPIMHTACKSCGKIAEFDVRFRRKLTCERCGSVIKKKGGKSIAYTFIFSISALLFFLPVLFFPILDINISSFNNSASIFSSVKTLAKEGLGGVGVVVILTSVAVPIAFLLLCAYVSLSALLGRKLPLFYISLRLTNFLQEWHMADVFLVGILISVVKLVDMSELSFKSGLYTMMFVCLLTALTEIYYDRLVTLTKVESHND